ncbi:MAG: AAA family ATPase [Alphaproteobacteria bacterium]|nr:AAA family ATPase [Alphaproteobacteria bacterium]
MSTVVPMPTPAAAATPAAAVSPFDFPPEFETKVATLTIMDDRFAKEAIEFMKPEHFTNVVERNLVAISQKFLASYGTPPSIKTMLDLIKSDARISSAEHPAYARTLLAMMKADLKEREYIRSRVVDFCKRQAILTSASKIPDLLKKGKFDEIRAVIDKAVSIGTENTMQFIEFFEEAAKREARREEMMAGTIVRGITTGVPEIDDNLYRKGYGRGEVTVILAPAKRGKTAFMQQSSMLSCMSARSNVLYVTLEVDEEIISDRGDAMVTGTDMADILMKRHDIAPKVAAMGRGSGKYWIERRAANSLTTDGVERIVESYMNSGRKIDLLVVDYLGILRLNPSDDRYVGLGNAVKELRRIAGKFDIAVLTATQTNRDAVGRELVGVNMIGESFAIVQDCDLMISINANDAEMAAGVRRLFFAASRNNPEVTIKVQGDLSKMQMIQTVIGVEY